MRVPDAIRKTVMFLGTRTSTGVEWSATGYLVSVSPGDRLITAASNRRFTETVRYPTTFMITARHVAEKLEGNPFLARVNKTDGSTTIIECGPGTKWWYHPRHRKYVDSAATLFVPPVLPDLDIVPIPLDMFADEQIAKDHNLGVGDEVFVTGLFTQTAETTRNIPIVRIGTVAMIPGEKLPFGDDLIEAQLIECRSVGGLSGSPVFIRETLQIQAGIRFKPGKSFANVSDSYPGESFDVEHLSGVGRFYFFGSVVGHWDKTLEIIRAEAVNMGIAPVVPAEKIKEVILQDGLLEFIETTTREATEKTRTKAACD